MDTDIRNRGRKRLAVHLLDGAREVMKKFMTLSIMPHSIFVIQGLFVNIDTIPILSAFSPCVKLSHGIVPTSTPTNAASIHCTIFSNK